MTDETILVTRFALLRQAEAEVIKTKRILGQNNNPLSDDDQEQAKKWAKVLRHFEWSRILTSDNGPAKETADIINLSLNLPIITNPGLREMDWGQWTGKTLEQINQEDPDLLKTQDEAGWDFQPAGGETLKAVLNRSLQALKDAHNEHPDETILAVFHEGIVGNIISHLLETTDDDEEENKKRDASVIFLTNQLHRIFYHNGEVKLEAMNSLPLP